MVNDYRGQIKKVNIRGCIICVYVCIYKQAYLCVHMYMYISSIETDPKMEGSQMIPATFFFFFFPATFQSSSPRRLLLQKKGPVFLECDVIFILLTPPPPPS